MSWTYRQEYVKCGRAGCKSCPHGPYWYGYKRDGKKLKKKYFGKHDPRQTGPEPPQPKKSPWDAILCDRTATTDLALEILGLKRPVDMKAAKSAYRRLSLEHHPDRGGDGIMSRYLNAAWKYLYRTYTK